MNNIIYDNTETFCVLFAANITKPKIINSKRNKKCS